MSPDFKLSFVFSFLYGGIVVWVGGVLLPRAMTTGWKVEVRWSFGLFSPIRFVGTGNWQRENLLVDLFLPSAAEGWSLGS